VLILGGDCITGHDPATGRELWRWGTWNPDKIPHWRMVTSPVAGGGVVLACAPKSEPVTALKMGGNGALDETSVAWRSQAKDVTADVPTPLVYRQHFYILNGHSRTKSLSCVEPATGRVLWTGTLESSAPFEASPTAAGGKVFCISQRGEVFVVAADPGGFELLHHTAMGEENDRQVRSSIVIAAGRLLIRTDTRLYCIGE
jgi:outer membrane protein assembly factor BamB